MQIFVSYRRASWPSARLLVNELREKLSGTVFIDVDSIDEDDFEISILKNLRTSDAFLLVVSEETFAPERIHQENDWIRREIREALRADIPVVLAMLEDLPLPMPETLPEDIREIAGKQWVKFYPEFFDAGVEAMVDFIAKLTGEAPLARKIATRDSTLMVRVFRWLWPPHFRWTVVGLLCGAINYGLLDIMGAPEQYYTQLFGPFWALVILIGIIGGIAND